MTGYAHLCARCSIRRWAPAAASTGVAHTLAVPVTAVLGVWSWRVGAMAAAAVAAAILVAYAVGIASAIVRGEGQLRRLAHSRGVEIRTFAGSWRAWLALPIAQ